MAALGILCLVVSLCVLQMCSASGKFYFRMDRYTTTCEESFSRCDVMFTFCFDKPSRKHSINRCAFYKTAESLQHSDEQDVSFGDNIGGIPNPVIFSVTSFADGGVMVVIRLMEHNDFESDELILTMAHNITFTPTNARSATYTSGSFIRGEHTFYYEYKAFCHEHFYGDCSQICVPTNSTVDGHYTCDSNGDKICLSGWEGDSCTTDVDECNSTSDICNTTNTSRVCANTDGSYRCDCPVAGWKGDHCDEDVNECEEVASTLCFNGGNCTNEPGSFSCICPANWTGPNCTDDVDECSTMTSLCAEGKSQCNNTLGGYQCICNKGWTGDYCNEDVDECLESNSTCANNSIECINTQGGYMCQCTDGWTGADCLNDIDECSKEEQVCWDQDSCQNLNGSFSCYCSNGTAGCYFEGGSINEEDDEFPLWPIVLVVVLLLVLIVIVVIFLMSRRRRRRRRLKSRSSRPPSVLELQAGNGTNTGISTGSSISTSTYRGQMLMFENSLYSANKANNRPTSTSSTSTDPSTRNPMPLPDLFPHRRTSGDYKDDLFVYHDLDDHADTPKLATAPLPPDGKFNEYANGHVGLDTRPYVGRNGTNTGISTGSSISPSTYRGQMLMFENSLYSANKANNRPTSTSSTSTDPSTRNPMPLPDLFPHRRTSGDHQDDLFVYHDMDNHADTPKLATAPLPPDGKFNQYANGHVGLDTRPYAGRGNHYEEFSNLKFKGDNKPIVGQDVDADGYVMPDVARSSLKQNDSNKPNTTEAKLTEMGRGAEDRERGYDNPAFSTDDEQTDIWPDAWVPEDMPVADDERGEIQEATPEDSIANENDNSPLWPPPPTSEPTGGVEDFDLARLGKPNADEDSEDDGAFEFIERRRWSTALGVDELDLHSLGEATTDDIDSVRAVPADDAEFQGGAPADDLDDEEPRADDMVDWEAPIDGLNDGEASSSDVDSLREARAPTDDLEDEETYANDVDSMGEARTPTDDLEDDETPANDVDSMGEARAPTEDLKDDETPAYDVDSKGQALVDDKYSQDDSFTDMSGFGAEDQHLRQFPEYELARNTTPNAYF